MCPRIMMENMVMEVSVEPQLWRGSRGDWRDNNLRLATATNSEVLGGRFYFEMEESKVFCKGSLQSNGMNISNAKGNLKKKDWIKKNGIVFICKCRLTNIFNMFTQFPYFLQLKPPLPLTLSDQHRSF